MSNNPSSTTVEQVEYVDNISNPININKIGTSIDSTSRQRSSFTDVEAINLDVYFSTLSTLINTPTAEDRKPHKRHKTKHLDAKPQVPRFPREQKRQMLNVFEWLQVVLDEGHIEPSQPGVGRLLGWPTRSFAINSLWVDFKLWCQKSGLAIYQTANKELFYSVLDYVFHRVDDRYEFPCVELCRKNYSDLRRNYVFIDID